MTFAMYSVAAEQAKALKHLPDWVQHMSVHLTPYPTSYKLEPDFAIYYSKPNRDQKHDACCQAGDVMWYCHAGTHLVSDLEPNFASVINAGSAEQGIGFGHCNLADTLQQQQRACNHGTHLIINLEPHFASVIDAGSVEQGVGFSSGKAAQQDGLSVLLGVA